MAYLFTEVLGLCYFWFCGHDYSIALYRSWIINNLDLDAVVEEMVLLNGRELQTVGYFHSIPLWLSCPHFAPPHLANGNGNVEIEIGIENAMEIDHTHMYVLKVHT